jgi:Rieske Fe-S protein
MLGGKKSIILWYARSLYRNKNCYDHDHDATKKPSSRWWSSSRSNSSIVRCCWIPTTTITISYNSNHQRHHTPDRIFRFQPERQRSAGTNPTTTIAATAVSFSSSSSSSSSFTTEDDKRENHYKNNRRLQQEIFRYQIGRPIEQSYSLPNTWYWDESIYQFEQHVIFFGGGDGKQQQQQQQSSEKRRPQDEDDINHVKNHNNNQNNNEKSKNHWIAVDILDPFVLSSPGTYQTGIFLGQPYLVTHNTQGILQGFYNICTHMGSCLVGPWTKNNNNPISRRSTCGNKNRMRLNASLVGQATTGSFFHDEGHKDEDDSYMARQQSNNGGTKQREAIFQCPYHGWQYNLDGRLIKAPNVKGIQNFQVQEFGLRKIPIQRIGPLLFMNFTSTTAGASRRKVNNYRDDNGDSVVRTPNDTTMFDMNRQLLENRMKMNGFEPDLSKLQFIAKKEYVVQVRKKIRFYYQVKVSF